METKSESKLIDDAISNCEQTIDKHQHVSSQLFYVIAFIVVIFFAIIVSTFLMTDYNIDRVSSLVEETKSLSSNLRYELGNLSKVTSTLRDMKENINDDAIVQAQSTFDPIQELMNDLQLLDRMYVTNVDSAVYSIRSLPGQVSTVQVKLNDIIQYIIYGIVILIFGVLTSFYRFRLKEISKYEHFLFGLYRIRIAAYGSNKGFDDEVRHSLAHSAFKIDESQSVFKKAGKIESPIPGHPTSDMTTLLLNKILEGIEITTKRKTDDKKEDG